jgi:uncharacterized protein
MYYNGDGVQKDYVQAYKWANLAAAKGHEKAVEMRRILEARMTREQIAEAQRLPAQFVPQKTGAAASP